MVKVRRELQSPAHWTRKFFRLTSTQATDLSSEQLPPALQTENWTQTISAKIVTLYVQWHEHNLLELLINKQLRY